MQFKEDTVEPSVPAREFNLKAYAAITWHKWSGQPGPRTPTRRSDNNSQKSFISIFEYLLVNYYMHTYNISAYTV